MLAFNFFKMHLRYKFSACFLLGWLISSVFAPVPIIVPDNSIVPQVTPNFFSQPVLDSHAILLRNRLMQLGFRPDVHTTELSQAAHGFASDNVRALLHHNQLSRTLLFVGPSAEGFKYAFVVTPEQAGPVFGGRGPRGTARMGLITVRRDGRRIDFNGFLSVENIGDRNLLQQYIAAADAPAQSGLPFSHDLYSLLLGITRGH